MTTRAERRRHARNATKGRVDHDAEYGMVSGWCAGVDELDEARRYTHDTLIELMGDRRAGPVQWTWTTGPDAGEVLNEMWRDADAAHADHYRRIAGLLREYGGYLVIAFAAGGIRDA